MIGTVEAAKSSFFDRAKVISAVDAATRRNLSKFGAYVRTDARSSLRYRERPSEPGQPPSIHKTMTRAKTSRKTGLTTTQGVSPLREFLFFAYEAGRKSVVIGPARLSGKLGNAPKALEYGGVSEVRTADGMTRKVAIRPRPFMGPAMMRTAVKLPEIWANSVRGN